MTARGQQGRWRSESRLWELPELVAQITTALASDDPQAVGVREFDRGRAVAGWPNAPTSAAVRRQLGGVDWPLLLDVVFGASHRRWQEVARWLEPLQRDRYTERDALEALRLVARLRGRPILREGEYAEGRHELLHTPAGRRLRFPSTQQVPYYAGCGSWSDALCAAGLDPDLDEDRDPRYERASRSPKPSTPASLSTGRSRRSRSCDASPAPTT